MTLPLDSGLKLAVVQWITWWSCLPWGSRSRGELCILSYHSCHIYRPWKSIQVGGFWSYQMRANCKRMGPFLWKNLTPQTTCNNFNLAIVRGLGWIKWLKNGAGKCLYFMQLSLHYIFFGESTFIFSMLESQSWKKKIVTKMERLKRW